MSKWEPVPDQRLDPDDFYEHPPEPTYDEVRQQEIDRKQFSKRVAKVIADDLIETIREIGENRLCRKQAE